MDLQSFIETYQLAPECIEGPGCLDTLLEQMAEGLAGRGNIPMIPSYLSLDTQPEIGVPCCVLDAGGTNLRVARAEFQSPNNCSLSNITRVPMPGTGRIVRQGILRPAGSVFP